MKTLKLGNCRESFLYRSDTLRFAWAGKIGKDNEIDVVSKMYSCRETAASCLRSLINNNWAGPDGTKQPEIETDKLRLVTAILDNGESCSEEGVLEAARAGLSIINLFEHRHGWPTTRLYKINVKVENSFVYMFYGSKKWIKNPYILSLLMLFLRLPFSWDEYCQIFDNYNYLMETVKRDADFDHSDDCIYVRNSHKYWDMIFSQYDELFCDGSLEYNWNTHRVGYDDGFHEGISRLCLRNSSWASLQKRFIELSEAWLKMLNDPEYLILERDRERKQRLRLQEAEQQRLQEERLEEKLRLIEEEKNRKWTFRDVISFALFWKNRKLVRN